MKRRQRSAHLLIWLVLTPALAAILWVSLKHRPAEPVNDALPPALNVEAG